MEIIQIRKDHYDEVRRIYLEGIATGIATFQTQAPSWEEWDAAHVKDCRLVLIEDGYVIGWAILSKVSTRAVYEGVAEVSIYVGKDYRGKGAGTILFAALIRESEFYGYWTLQAGIFPENTASIRLHEKHGFRQLGRRERIGKLNGIWRDVVLLERRSKIVGLN